MAKGQKRGNREVKKPKTKKKPLSGPPGAVGILTKAKPGAS